MILDFICGACKKVQKDVFVWERHELTNQEKERLTCCGKEMSSFIDYSEGKCATVKGTNHLEKTRKIALKRSQDWDKKELPEIKREQIKNNFFNG